MNSFRVEASKIDEKVTGDKSQSQLQHATQELTWISLRGKKSYMIHARATQCWTQLRIVGSPDPITPESQLPLLAPPGGGLSLSASLINLAQIIEMGRIWTIWSKISYSTRFCLNMYIFKSVATTHGYCAGVGEGISPRIKAISCYVTCVQFKEYQVPFHWPSLTTENCRVWFGQEKDSNPDPTFQCQQIVDIYWRVEMRHTKSVTS